MSDVTWSDDRITTLSKLWLEGLSASQIAKRLGGITRNAVIGKVHRLGLSGRPAPAAPARIPRTTILRARRAPRRAPAPRPSASCPRGGRRAARRAGPCPRYAPAWRPCLQVAHRRSQGRQLQLLWASSRGRYCTAHERVGVRAGAAWRADRDPVVKRALAGLV